LGIDNVNYPQSSTEYGDFDLAFNPDKKLSHNQLGILPGLEFIQKGGKSGSGTYKAVTTFNYIELPVPICYRHNFDNDAKWTAGIGPYFSYGVGGNTKFTSNGQTTKSKVFEAGGYKRFDAGLTACADYMFASGLYLGIDYDLGLANVLSGNGVSAKNRSLSLNVGYSLNKLFHTKNQKK
jgi:hypothetical protein